VDARGRQFHLSSKRVELGFNFATNNNSGAGVSITVTPQNLAVLRYVVEYAGHLVTCEELIKALRPGTHGAERGPKRGILDAHNTLENYLKECST
jgi:DNA-binding response OmpR family regulator